MKDFKKLIREAHLGNPLNEDKLPDGFHSKEDLDQFLKDNPFDSERYKKLSIAQKQDILSYLNRDTEKEFERRMAMREEFSSTEWPKELTSRYSDEYRFELEKVMSDRAKYRVIDIESGELKGTPVFGKPESLMAYADNLIKPQGGTQSSHFGTNEGTCGYGEDGVIGDKPAGAHLQKEDINDPVLVKARAAQMKRDAIDKKDLENKSKRISADKAIDLRYELSILDKEREDILMRIEDIAVEMDQTAEPEGGPIADELGERLMAAQRELRAIDSKIIDIKDDLGVFDMNESVNEEYSDLDLYYRKGYKDFTGLVNRIVGEKDLEEKRKLMHVYINILPKASREKKFKLKQSINKMGPSQIDKFAYNILMRDSRMTSLEEDDEVNLNVSTANTKYAEEEDKVANSGAYESLQETLRKNLANRLK